MTKSLDVFCETPCLTEQSKLLGGIALQKNGSNQQIKESLGNTFKSLLNTIRLTLTF